MIKKSGLRCKGNADWVKQAMYDDGYSLREPDKSRDAKFYEIFSTWNFVESFMMKFWKIPQVWNFEKYGYFYGCVRVLRSVIIAVCS